MDLRLRGGLARVEGFDHRERGPAWRGTAAQEEHLKSSP